MMCAPTYKREVTHGNDVCVMYVCSQPQEEDVCDRVCNERSVSTLLLLHINSLTCVVIEFHTCTHLTRNQLFVVSTLCVHMRRLHTNKCVCVCWAYVWMFMLRDLIQTIEQMHGYWSVSVGGIHHRLLRFSYQPSVYKFWNQHTHIGNTLHTHTHPTNPPTLLHDFVTYTHMLIHAHTPS